VVVVVLNKENLPQQWKESITVPIRKKCNKIDCSNYRGIEEYRCYQLHTKLYPIFFFQG